MSALENIIPISVNSNTNTTAQVKSVSDDLFELTSGERVLKARKAFSCLMEPIVSDTVLYSLDENQQAYIIAILHRQVETESSVNLPENTMINCPKELTIRSGVKTTFISNSVHQLTKQFLLKSEDAVLKLQNMVYQGKKLHAHIPVIHTVSDILNTVSRQALQKFTSYMRKSEQMDQVQAGQMGRKVDGLYTLDSKHTIMVSKKETKIDGEHIHMG